MSLSQDRPLLVMASVSHLSKGLKFFVINFKGSKYTCNVGNIKFTPKDATGIDEIVAEANKSNAKMEIYTLDGRKVNAANLQKGIYIVNGKKVVVK